eukprot:EG_transcript_1714
MDFASLFSPFHPEGEVDEQLSALFTFKEMIDNAPLDEVAKVFIDVSTFLLEATLRDNVKLEVLQTIAKSCGLLGRDAKRLGASYVVPLVGWVADATNGEEVRAEAARCVRRILEDVAGPLLDGDTIACLMQFIREKLQGFPGETTLLTCFDCIRVLSLDSSTFSHSEFWQFTIDALHRLKDSTDLPETVLAEVNRSYSQLLFHLRELEVKSPLRFVVRDSYIESPGAGRILSTITNTVEALRFSAMKHKSARSIFGKENSSQEVFSPRPPLHRISFEFVVSPQQSPVQAPPSFDFFSLPFPTALPQPRLPSHCVPSLPPVEPLALFEDSPHAPDTTTVADSASAEAHAEGGEQPEAETLAEPAAACPEGSEPLPDQPSPTVEEELPSDLAQTMDLDPVPEVGGVWADPSSEEKRGSKRCREDEEEGTEQGPEEEDLRVEDCEDSWLAAPQPPCSAVTASGATDTQLVCDERPDGDVREAATAPSADPIPISPVAEEALVVPSTPSLVERLPEPTAPIVEEPIVPMVEELTAPVAEEPAAPMTEEPTAPLAEEPVVPMTEEPIVPMAEESITSPSPAEEAADSVPPPAIRPPTLCLLPTAARDLLPPADAATTPRSDVAPLLSSRPGSPGTTVHLSPSFDLAGFHTDPSDALRMEMDHEYRLLHQQYLDLEEQYIQLKGQYEELQSNHAEVTKRNEQRKATIAEMNKNEDWYQARIQELEREAVEQQQRYQGLYTSATEKLAIAERELNARDASLQITKREAQAVEQQLQTSTAELKDLKERLVETEQKLTVVTEQLSVSKEQLQREQAGAATAQALLEERSAAVHTATQRLLVVEKSLEDSRTHNEARMNTLRAELALMKAKLAERETEVSTFQEAMASQHLELEAERRVAKDRLLQIITHHGGGAPPQDQSLIACVEQITAIVQRKAQEREELLGYCQQLLERAA